MINNILAMHTFEKADIVCDFILKDGFVTGVRSSDNYHFHSFFEIHYVIQGKMHLMINDRDIFLKDGDVCIIPPNMVHFIFDDKDSYRIGFRFSFMRSKSSAQECYCNRFQEAFGKLKEPFIVNDSSLFQQCLRASGEALAENAPAYIIDELLFLAIDRLSYSVLHKSYVSEKSSNIYSDSLISEYIEDFLNIHYQGTPKIGELADSLSLSVRQTQRVIFRLFGMTFSKLLALKRLTVARFLLRTTALPVEEISHRAGFCDKHYFYRKFQAHYGITPAQYRNKVKNDS